jgi:serine/threonine protein kinase
MQGTKLLVEEVVGWKWLHHENILPFVGVTASAPPFFSIISEWMENGDIMHFTRTRPDYNRLLLVRKSNISGVLTCLTTPTQLVEAVTGLEYLHGHGIVHGDLKGVSWILSWSLL